MSLKLNFLGNIEIYENDKSISIPLGKTGGVLIYVLLKKNVTRDELAGLFWAESNNSLARTSLRNAIYKIRKLFKDEVILSSNKNVVSLNEKIKAKIDVDIFKENPSENLDLYRGDFLNNFYVKDASKFEEWVDDNRGHYRELFVKTAEIYIKENFSNEDISNIETVIDELLNIDNYNEFAYLHLLKLYKSKNRHDKIINKYYEIKRLFSTELGVDPNKEIYDIYLESYNKLKKENKNENNNNLYGREYEKKLVLNHIKDFSNNKKFPSIIIEGETGIGKSTFVKNIRETVNINSDIEILDINCYYVESTFSLSLWIKIIRRLDDEIKREIIKKPPFWDEMIKKLFLNSDALSQSNSNIIEKKELINFNLINNFIINSLDIITKDKKLLIIIEDIQWSGNLSLKILISLILNANNNIMFLMTTTNVDLLNLSENFITLDELKKLKIIKFDRFSKIEVTNILKEIFKDKISKDTIDHIYFETKGNAFFLNEFIKLYKSNNCNEFPKSLKLDNNYIIQEKFQSLSKEEKEILDIISVFSDEVSIYSLTNISGISSYQILSSLNKLIRLNILQENKDINNKVTISFSYSAYRTYIYNNLSELSKQYFHSRIADYLDSKFSINKDIAVCMKLQYHYSKSGNLLYSLKYDLMTASYYFNFSHELFPEEDELNFNKKSIQSLDNEESKKWLNNIEEKLNSIKFQTNSNQEDYNEFIRIEHTYIYCKSRYLIRCGDYNVGVPLMENLISYLDDDKDIRLKLNCIKQLIIYSIQINDLKIMKKWLDLGIELAKKSESVYELGILLRLNGVYYLMDGNSTMAEIKFRESINLLVKENLDIYKSTKISIAANYNYLGEISFAQNKLKEALSHFEKAVSLCEENIPSCLSLFYFNISKTYLLMNDYKKMDYFISLSKEIIDKFDSYWKKPVIYALLSMSSFVNGDYNKSLEYLSIASTDVNIINNPRDKGLVFFIQTLIKKISLEKNIKFNFLTEPLEYYYFNAMEFLDKFRDSKEIEYLKELIDDNKFLSD